MQHPGVRRDPSALASVAEGLPFTESAFAGCTVPVVALPRGSAMAIIVTVAAPMRRLI